MFGSTFTESLSAAPHLYDEFKTLVAEANYYFVFTLHPKIAPQQKANYRALQGKNARYVDAWELPHIIPHIHVLVADTTSLISECVVMLKPVICFRNREPKPFMIQIELASQLRSALRLALTNDSIQSARIQEYADLIHPSRDGLASERILDALLRFRFDGLAKKPMNVFRKLSRRIFYRFLR